MNLRMTLNRHPVLVAALVVVLVAVAIASLVSSTRRQSEVLIGPRKAFYTVDDGQTWFVDDIDKMTPFDHEGKPAVQVHLFTCDGGKTKFVGYLERLPDGALEHYRSRTGDTKGIPEADDVAEIVGSMVKRKGDVAWVRSDEQEQFRETRQVRCPDGRAEVEPVWPE